LQIAAIAPRQSEQITISSLMLVAIMMASRIPIMSAAKIDGVAFRSAMILFRWIATVGIEFCLDPSV